MVGLVKPALGFGGEDVADLHIDICLIFIYLYLCSTAQFVQGLGDLCSACMSTAYLNACLLRSTSPLYSTRVVVRVSIQV